MIPILYRIDENNYLSNGIGRLTDCVSCIVTEERNGIYELEFEYPITGKFYNEILKNNGVVACIHDDKKDLQLFDIYSHTDPIDGIVKFNAHHVSYRLANVILRPFTAEGIANVFDRLPNESMNTCQFTFWTDKISTNTYRLNKPANIRSILGGSEGSILDIFGGGDYEFDKFQVKLYANRGNDTGITIRYGKNLADIQNNVDTGSTYAAMIPYWVNSETGEVVYGDIVYSPTFRSALIPWTNENNAEMQNGSGTVIEFTYPVVNVVEKDFSDQFQVAPTKQQLEDEALSFMIRNETWKPYQNIDIDFVQLWQTPEYENIASLQRVSLCDTVSVYYPEMGIVEAEQKVIKTVYNVLTERYDKMELGMAKTTFTDVLFGDLNELLNNQSAYLQSVIESQTALITGGLGGHVVTTLNASGEPQEILIMDTDDKDTAVNVIRMNQNGIGFSTNGYEGPFESAWTIDGVFNADFIATGHLVANYIRGGTLALGGYDDAYGLFQLLNADGSVNFQYDKDGMHHVTYDQTTGGYECAYGTEINGPTIQSYYAVPTHTAHKVDINSGVISFYESSTGGTGYDDLDYIRAGYIDGGVTSEGYYIRMSNMAGGTNDPPSIWIWYLLNSGYASEISLQSEACRMSGNFVCYGTKSRTVETEEYGNRLLYCYETPSPLFGDVGEGVIDETGFCYVFLDAVFAETIATRNYQVFLQKYGNGDCWVSERHPDYFVVQGSAGLSFGWELKSKQADFDQMRLEKENALAEAITHDYGTDGSDFYEQLMKGREAA